MVAGKASPTAPVGGPTPTKVIRPDKPAPAREAVGESQLFTLRGWMRRAEGDLFLLRAPEVAVHNAVDIWRCLKEGVCFSWRLTLEDEIDIQNT